MCSRNKEKGIVVLLLFFDTMTFVTFYKIRSKIDKKCLQQNKRSHGPGLKTLVVHSLFVYNLITIDLKNKKSPS